MAWLILGIFLLWSAGAAWRREERGWGAAGIALSLVGAGLAFSRYAPPQVLAAMLSGVGAALLLRLIVRVGMTPMLRAALLLGGCASVAFASLEPAEGLF